jgi:hypothetical protein
MENGPRWCGGKDASEMWLCLESLIEVLRRLECAEMDVDLRYVCI